MDDEHQLGLAVEDNVAWCRAVCSAHRLVERLSETVWVNLEASPRFYPRIISRKPGAQASVIEAIDEIRQREAVPGWGIKDSFGDLDLEAFGFKPVVEASWYICPPQAGPAMPVDAWSLITSESDLLAWETTWNGEEQLAVEERVFPPKLLEEEAVEFWQCGLPGTIRAGFIAHRTGGAVGLSNWFSEDKAMEADRAAIDAAAFLFSQQPIVFWSADDVAGDGVLPIGRLKVWISTE